jgi:hypothetical protein
VITAAHKGALKVSSLPKLCDGAGRLSRAASTTREIERGHFAPTKAPRESVTTAKEESAFYQPDGRLARPYTPPPAATRLSRGPTEETR